MENNGYFIKKLRLSKNLTQSQLAEGILSKNFLSRYERGESQVNDSTFLRLLERMNIYFSEFEELFQGENSQKEFLNEVIKAKKENDAYLWEVLKKARFHTIPNFQYRISSLKSDASIFSTMFVHPSLQEMLP